MHGNLDPEENVLPDADEHEDLPKVKLNFDTIPDAKNPLIT